MAKAVKPVGYADPKKLGKGTIAIIVLLGLMAGGAIVFRATRQPTVASESGEAAVESRPGAGVNRPARDVLTAETVEWTDLYGTALPIAAAGPHKTPGNRALEFDRSESGAVLAAIHIVYRTEAGPGPAVFKPTIEEQVVGVDKPRLLVNAENQYEEARLRAAPGPNGEILESYRTGQRLQTTVWGYRVDAYSDDAASIGILVRQIANGGPIYGNFSVGTRWVEGDWRLVAPVNGQYKNSLHILQQVPTGYVVLGGGTREPADG